MIQLLADDGESKKQPPKVVAIVGSGGLGKTTLANKVYQELKRGFDCDAFFSVSQNPDIVSVMSKIFSQLNKNYSAAAKEDLPTLITKVRDFLTDRNKRYCFGSFLIGFSVDLLFDETELALASKLNWLNLVISLSVCTSNIYEYIFNSLDCTALGVLYFS